MSFFAKMERKFGKYAIKNLPAIVTACFGIGYLLEMFVPSVITMIYFSPWDIIVGHEYWRLFTWIFTPPGSVDILAILMLFIYFSFGLSIEQSMGTFMFNVFIFGGWLVNTVLCLAVSIFEYIRIGDLGSFLLFSINSNGLAMTDLMQISIFLGFALIYADSVMLLFFVIPLKAIWLAYIDILFLAYRFIATDNIITRASIIAYMLNFVFIYLGTRVKGRKRSRQGSMGRSRNRHFKVYEGGVSGEVKREKSVITKHKCAVCGRTERDDPTLEFRFCSKCNGNYEYCSDHLYTHEHVR